MLKCVHRIGIRPNMACSRIYKIGQNLCILFSDLNLSVQNLRGFFFFFSSCSQEEETLSFIKESLEKSDQLTKNMVGMS